MGNSIKTSKKELKNALEELMEERRKAHKKRTVLMLQETKNTTEKVFDFFSAVLIVFATLGTFVLSVIISVYLGISLKVPQLLNIASNLWLGFVTLVAIMAITFAFFMVATILSQRGKK